MGYRERILACHTADLGAFVPWRAAGRRAGFVHRDHLPVLHAAGSAFADIGGELQLGGADAAERSRLLAATVAALVANGALRPPLGEAYPVLDPATHEPLAELDRIAVPWFGVLARGVHLNGFVRTEAGISVWLARRAAGKRTFGGHLDNVVAGGQGSGFTAAVTLQKECAEEAAIPAELAARAVCVGALGYRQQDGRSLKVDRLVCYDLELPLDFTPRPVDGEVERFELWPAAEVASALRGDAPWKPNCALVALDFLLRRGLLDRELAAAERHALWRALHVL